MVLDIRKKNIGEDDLKHDQNSRRTKLILLILLCLLSGSITFYMANRSFSSEHDLPISSSSIRKPVNIHLQGKAMSLGVRISEKEYQRIQNFKQYLDSIGNAPSSRRVFDSIITARPGLIDSILIIEHFYLSQSKE